jgi:signal transduction histidine kinase
VPIRLESTVPDGTELPPELERNAYFIVAEAITNVAKHAGASRATIAVALRRVPDLDQTWLDLTVTDDGHGGAAIIDGHGFGNLRERVQGLGGILELTSPAGGPTVVAAHLPVNQPAG